MQCAVVHQALSCQAKKAVIALSLLEAVARVALPKRSYKI